jgi:SAM-dependent methyltransferase
MNEQEQSKLIAFDRSHYLAINEARATWLSRVIQEMPSRESLKTALDVGCGAGFFAKLLNDLNFQVKGIDLREENITVCRQRYPEIQFDIVDLDVELPNLGVYDVVLMFGILYHLQSPLQSILALSKIIGEVGIVETRIASGDSMACYLFHEAEGEAHNHARVTLVPTLPALIRMFIYAGFDYVYRPKYQPDHEQWKRLRNGQRHCLVVSRRAIDNPEWDKVDAPDFIRKWKPMNVISKI